MEKSVFYILVFVGKEGSELQIATQLRQCVCSIEITFVRTLGETSNALDSLSYDLVVFIQDSQNTSLNSAWMTFCSLETMPPVLVISDNEGIELPEHMTLLSRNHIYHLAATVEDLLSEKIMAAKSSLAEEAEEDLSYAVRDETLLQDISTSKEKSASGGGLSLLHQELIREEERERIAREIHDELGNELLAIRLDMDWLFSKLVLEGDSLARFQRVRRIVDSLTSSIRRIARDLRPGILRDFGIVEALKMLASDFQEKSGISIRFSSNVDYLSMEQKKALAVYRIQQEALVNVVKHSFSSKVNIILNVSTASLSLTIEDNGIGVSDFDLSKPKSIGLQAMKERVEMHGGKIFFSESAGGGFCILVDFPIP